MKKKNKGFTLIELLAVIVILGLLMAIAIPSVTKYITQSRKKTLTNTIGNYMGALVNEVNDMVYTFTGTNTIYAVPIECIAVERGGTNPFGKWHQASDSYWAYVLVQYDDLTSSYKYGFTFKDSAGYGLYPTTQDKLKDNGNQIKTGLDLIRPKNGYFLENGATNMFKNSGFIYNYGTMLKVLASESDDKIGDGVNTCTLIQKGDNYAEIEDDKVNQKDIISSIYYHNGSNIYDANDGSYRYYGFNPNNYVCFGSDAYICSADNLYRIIGVFGDNIKLVKSKQLFSTQWNGTGESGSGNIVNIDNKIYQNYWYYKDVMTDNVSISTLNEKLNGRLFYGIFDSKWQEMIVEHEWNIGGYNNYSIIGRDIYNIEKKEKWIGKIGLLTPSDYAFAAENEHWSTTLNNYNNSAYLTDWLKPSSIEWLMTRFSGKSFHGGITVFSIHPTGYLFGGTAYSYSRTVRPSFYLDSSVNIISGTGTSSDPYRLSM